MGGSSISGKIVNGRRYLVTKVGERVSLKDERTKEEFDMNTEAISKHCLLAL